MLKITSDKVYLTRGDTADILINIYDADKQAYELQPGDSLIFTLKANCVTDNYFIQKECPDSKIHLLPDDTNTLSYGTYYFDVQLTTALGQVYTVIPPHEFILSKEVTFHALP